MIKSGGKDKIITEFILRLALILCDVCACVVLLNDSNIAVMLHQQPQ